MIVILYGSYYLSYQYYFMNSLNSSCSITSSSLLTADFLSQYGDFPKHMTPLGMFVYLRTYSRFLVKEKRRETYKETCIRATLYNIQLVINHLQQIGYPIDKNQLHYEACYLFDNMFNLKQFLSGRTLWIGGTKAADMYSLSNFNCAALNISKWYDLCDLFYLLMVGTGVGFKSTKQFTQQMAKIRNNVTLIHSKYVPLLKKDRLESTKLSILPNGFAKIYVGDSKEGWVDSLRYFIDILVEPEYEYIHTIKISYNSVRPTGERLLTFGGTSSGPQPLKEMFDGFDKVLKNQMDTWLQPMVPDDKGYVQVRPIHIMDMGNLIGQNVVVGGVRRCLPKGSLVHLKTGLTPIEDVKIGDDVLTYEGYNKVVGWFDQGVRDIIQINTQDGYFECTENHRMPVLRGFNSIEWITTDQLKPKDILLTSRVPIEGVITQLPLNIGYDNHIVIKNITIPKLDPDMAWFIGLFLVSGYVHQHLFSICIQFHHRNISNKCIDQILRFDPNITIYTSHHNGEKPYQTICNSVHLATYLQKHIKINESDMRIPDWILNSTLEIRKAFVAGVIDGSGIPTDNIVSINTYEKFVTKLQCLLYSCGIESRLFINTSDPEYIQFSHQPVHFLRLFTQYSISEINNIPQLCFKFNGKQNIKCVNSFPISFCDDKMIAKYSLDPNKPLSVDTYEQLIGKLNYCPVNVRSIQVSIRKYTYDISVENQHNFYCNGYLSHNTAEMFIFEPDDYEVLFAKYGINGLYNPNELKHHIKLGQELDKINIKPKWFDEVTKLFELNGQFVRPNLSHRRLSNNSIMFSTQPSIDYLKVLFNILRYEGEPGLLNMESMRRRRPNAELVNPCVTGDTLILTDKGELCVNQLIGTKFNVIVNGRTYSSSPDGFFKTGRKKIYRLTTVDGHIVRLTGNHKVLIYRKQLPQPSNANIRYIPYFSAACQITPTDYIAINNPLSDDLNMSLFNSCIPDGCEEDVYDCTIEGIHMFSANDIIVHNCGEILLDTYQTCNLTTVNLTQFIEKNENDQYVLNEAQLIEAQKLSVRAGIRMTLVQLELPHWDKKQKRDRLVGTSLTGIKDTIDCLNYTQTEEIRLISKLGDVARQESIRYAKELRIPAPLLTTTIKPEGSLSQVAGGISQGLHLSHSPFFIRRIRISANDPIVQVIKKANWRINPEVGTQGNTYEEKMNNARTLVVDFPVSTQTKKTKYQTTIDEQLNTYFTYQQIYADHNCSNTISVHDDEWERLPQLIYDNWDKYIGVTFIPLDGGHYELAPYEECSQAEYLQLKNTMGEFDMNTLQHYDQELYLNDMASTEASVSLPSDETIQSECVGGVCPIR